MAKRDPFDDYLNSPEFEIASGIDDDIFDFSALHYEPYIVASVLGYFDGKLQVCWFMSDGTIRTIDEDDDD